jgi:hypothetical protein
VTSIGAFLIEGNGTFGIRGKQFTADKGIAPWTFLEVCA